MIYKQAVNSSHADLSSAWSMQLSQSDRQTIEANGNCCGFNDPSDRIEQTSQCSSVDVKLPGCYSTLQTELYTISKPVYLALGALAIVELLAVLAGFFVLCSAESSKDNSPLDQVAHHRNNNVYL